MSLPEATQGAFLASVAAWKKQRGPQMEGSMDVQFLSYVVSSIPRASQAVQLLFAQCERLNAESVSGDLRLQTN